MDSFPTAVILEDDLATQALLAAVARRCGLTPRVASDGEAGIALILAERPAVLIIDLILPRMSGLEVLRRISEVAPSLLSRTVIVTAADEGMVRRAISELRSVRCVMRKPLDIEELAEQLDDCMRGAAGLPLAKDVPPATIRRGVRSKLPN